MNKLKSFMTIPDSLKSTTNNKNVNKYNHNDKLEPEVGFRLILETGDNSECTSKSSKHATTNSVPELQVQLIGARHLPSTFGLKCVEGYMIKIKLFPGSARYDSRIQTSSWPNFNETFKFPLQSSHKSSLRVKTKASSNDNNNNETVPGKFFKGNFVVFTVFALLDLPASTGSALREKYNNFKRNGSLILKNKPIIGKFIMDDCNTDNKDAASKLTTSESQRNIGSVTCFLDPKLFIESTRLKTYMTEEMWMPIRDITITPSLESKCNVLSSPKGQVEVILQLCDYRQIVLDNDTSPQEDKNFNINGPSSSVVKYPVINRQDSVTSTNSSTKSRFSFTEMKNMVKSSKNKDKPQKGVFLKIGISKMRCSIKVKEEFESVTDKIYIKTTVLEREILSSSWRSAKFSATLSTRWSPEDSTITIPIIDEQNLEHISIKITLATKTKVGKKIVLGSIMMGSNSTGNKLEHWDKMVASQCIPVQMWHNFE